MGKPHIAVIGAGAFGGWTALELLREGARVSLIDAWGPGHGRASSGGETRLIRGIYGADEIYIRWVARAFQMWRDFEEVTGARLYRKTGALWMFSCEDTYARASLPHLARLGFSVDELSVAAARTRFPQIFWDDIQSVFFEKEAGYLFARQACERVWQRFVEEGGVWLPAWVEPGPIRNGRLDHIKLSNGSTLQADHYVFACGPWLGQLFPEVLGHLIRPTRQEVFFFGLPPAAEQFMALPAWMDYGKAIRYGVPYAAFRGFKVADDTRGPSIDPSNDDRLVSPACLNAAREHLAHRFPSLGRLPLLESRVCQYENTPDGQYIIDHHPEAGNCLFLGGGSGHGFKLGPAVGEYVARCLLRNKPLDPFFALSRFNGRQDGREQLRRV